MVKDASMPLLVLVGPTAVGKTALSLKLATQFNGEIISADSRLFYRGMDIGTAKPAAAEQAIAPHHLIDICAPDETVTLGQYQKLAYDTITAVQARGHLPILVGGTGQYVMAVTEGWGIPKVPPQPELRTELEKLGGEELARWLALLDPIAAAKIDPRNVRRVVRALEVTLVNGRAISEQQRKTPPPYDICIIGLQRQREVLYERIDARVDAMMAAGLVAEVEGLRQAGYGRQLPAMSGLGYRQIWDYLVDDMELAEAVDRVKFETHRFARQQATWFRQDDERIHWFDLGDVEVAPAVFTFVHNWLNAAQSSGAD
jgi:tRNA dimethylallyltransferase